MDKYSEQDYLRVRDIWQSRWQEALSLWSRYTRLSMPRWCLTQAQEQQEGLNGSFAMIRLSDHAVVVSIRQIVALGLEEFSLHVLAHEIGHHVYCPGDLNTHGRLLARIKAGLPGKAALAPFVANLYSDLMINDRLARSAGLSQAPVFERLALDEPTPIWLLYLRIYEILWSLPRTQLTRTSLDTAMEGDALLGARLVRAYRKRWLDGAGRFACLCFSYLLEEGIEAVLERLKPWHDTRSAGVGGEPMGLIEQDPQELKGAVHPAADPQLNPAAQSAEDGAENGAGDSDEHALGGRKNTGDYRGVIEYGELLESLGLNLDEHAIAQRYYRERALPHLVRFPQARMPKVYESEYEGLQDWGIGDALEDADWYESVIRSPQVIPGFTTVQRAYSEAPGDHRQTRAVDLYIGIDCSGSMPNPQRQLSFPALAGVIMALSALRAGARVKVVLSGEPGRSVSTPDFQAQERQVLPILTDYLGSGYAFGIHRLQETFGAAMEKPTHILIITDQDIFSMLDDEQNAQQGWDVAERALAAGGGGGTMVLHMPANWQDERLERLRQQGWGIHRLYDWEELIGFAAAFSRAHFDQANS